MKATYQVKVDQLKGVVKSWYCEVRINNKFVGYLTHGGVLMAEEGDDSSFFVSRDVARDIKRDYMDRLVRSWSDE